ncbi:hypothetical protein NKDENANG_02619 [Candidatus Entotheonellaceae bacterium PAL068K]
MLPPPLSGPRWYDTGRGLTLRLLIIRRSQDGDTSIAWRRDAILTQPMVDRIQVGVDALALQERLVRTHFYYASVCQHHHLVGVADG